MPSNSDKTFGLAALAVAGLAWQNICKQRKVLYSLQALLVHVQAKSVQTVSGQQPSNTHLKSAMLAGQHTTSTSQWCKQFA